MQHVGSILIFSVGGAAFIWLIYYLFCIIFHNHCLYYSVMDVMFTYCGLCTWCGHGRIILPSHIIFMQLGLLVHAWFVLTRNRNTILRTQIYYYLLLLFDYRGRRMLLFIIEAVLLFVHGGAHWLVGGMIHHYIILFCNSTDFFH